MRVVRDWEPSTESEKVVYDASVEAAAQFWNARRLRIIACQRGIPALEWCAVVLGAIVTVSLTYFLVLDDIRIQVALTAMVAVLIALNIFLILMFGYPFSGDLRVTPDSFEVVLAFIQLDGPSGSLNPRGAASPASDGPRCALSGAFGYHGGCAGGPAGPLDPREIPIHG